MKDLRKVENLEEKKVKLIDSLRDLKILTLLCKVEVCNFTRLEVSPLALNLQVAAAELDLFHPPCMSTNVF